MDSGPHAALPSPTITADTITRDHEAAHAVFVLTFAVAKEPACREERILLSVGDLACHPVQPLERVESLEVASQEGIHLGAVEHGLLAIEIHELLEGEGISDQAGASVQKALGRVRGRAIESRDPVRSFRIASLLPG